MRTYDFGTKDREDRIRARVAERGTPAYEARMAAGIARREAAETAAKEDEKRRRQFDRWEDHARHRDQHAVPDGAVDRAICQIEAMVSDGVSDFPDVNEDDIAHELTLNWCLMNLGTTPRSIGTVAEVLRCHLGWYGSEIDGWLLDHNPYRRAS